MLCLRKQGFFGFIMRKLSPRREFVIYCLGTLCFLSLSLNFDLLLERKRPEFWKDLRLSFKKPPSVLPLDHAKGPIRAAVTVIEYSDYQCPYSREMHSELRKLYQNAEIRWIFRDRPFESLHPFAMKAAIAAQCAGRQGKFWEYSDALFDHQVELTSESLLEDLASGLELNVPDFDKCRDSNISEALRSQIAAADALEIHLTPTVFVNGKRLNGLVPYSTLSGLIQK
jgi:protein-disulfide isomerase